MHITVEPSDNHAILHLRGEFDTYYCPLLQQEIENTQKAGITKVVLNLRMVKFINSTALGAIIKASKTLGANGGQLVISHPSTFCRDILEKVGLNRVVSVLDTDEDAVAQFDSPAAPDTTSDEGAFEEDTSSVLFTLKDKERLQHFIESVSSDNPVHGHAFGSNWSGVGRMSSLSAEGLAFTWSGGSTGLSPFEMGQMLALGTPLSVKFRLPLLQRGYCEAVAEVEQLEERADGVKLACGFKDIDADTLRAVVQYAQDMELLKGELGETVGEGSPAD
jgi:anti-anti-sigma factor